MLNLATFHSDLLMTTIDDFTEHFDAYVVASWSELLRKVASIPPDAHFTWENQPSEKGDEWQIRGEVTGTDYIVQVSYQHLGAARRQWLCMWHKPYRWFILSAGRYCTDRIKVSLLEFDVSGSTPVYAPVLRSWLSAGWSDALVELPLENVPVLRGDFVLLPMTRPVPKESIYQWDDLFDWWYRGGRVQGYPNVKDLAKDFPYDEGTINNRHSEYVKQFGKAAIPDRMSKFAGMGTIVKIIHDTE